MDQIARAKQLEIVLRRAEQTTQTADKSSKGSLATHGLGPAAVASISQDEPELSAYSAG